MTSEEIGLNSPLVFQNEPLHFNCAPSHQRRVPDTDHKTREFPGIEDKLFSVDRADRFFTPQPSDFRRNILGDGPERRNTPDTKNWNANDTATTPSGEESDSDDVDMEDEDDDEVENERFAGIGVDDDNRGTMNDINLDDNNGSVSSLHGCGHKLQNGKAKHHLSFAGREILLKEGNMSRLINNGNGGTNGNVNHQQERLGNFQNDVAVAETDGDVYYSQFLKSTEASSSIQKDMAMENGYGFSGRKDFYSSESGNSLRSILSDPITGELMDDAMILPCGHSFGSGGIQHVLRMKVCCTCSQSISEDSLSPNLSLRTAVQAFRREEESQFHRLSKRRREKLDQDKGSCGDSALTETSRYRGVQFPFAVLDRVIIKGNKRTPQRFVGREAIVTTQCLNGWYVVKTLDNAESVKLQYRSLSKVSDDPSKPTASKMGPSWL